MSEAWVDLPGDAASGMLLIADHASNRVPAGLDLGVPDSILTQHVAVDIGVAGLAEQLCATLRCPGILGAVSRLVIDFNREENTAGLIPRVSDGHLIAGNAALTTDEVNARVSRYWWPYHDHIAELIKENAPKLLISLHSFTPCLATSEERRPWEIGILYNRDDRAAQVALPWLEQAGIVAGDNLPYSGTMLNATMNRHGEDNALPYLGIEVRQDLIGNAGGIDLWAGQLARLIRHVNDVVRADG